MGVVRAEGFEPATVLLLRQSPPTVGLRAHGAGWTNRTPAPCLQGKTSATEDKPAWSWSQDSNLPPRLYESRALPDELGQQNLNKGLPASHSYPRGGLLSASRASCDAGVQFWTFTMTKSGALASRKALHVFRRRPRSGRRRSGCLPGASRNSSINLARSSRGSLAADGVHEIREITRA